MLAVVNEYHKSKGSDGNMKNLFISVGCLIIENYAQVILKYNDQLSPELKRQLTLLVNNLQICTQLQNRISGLEEGITESNEKLEELPYDSEMREEIIKRKKRLNKSLVRKEKKLSQLNQENVNFLLRLGRQFYEQRLLDDNEEFSKLYDKLDCIAANKESNSSEDDGLATDFDINMFNLNNLMASLIY
ncbi:hypothetical protein Halha_0900 [Halobacteroides halobius DSM 5150]|uniref:Uncharacterized protein n=1 Tax=Halobacteroides halobius (strain ATCC 35273 / DSM 5150 / MD-1) TaxID=748449 RepID=L0K791_HALHC|nr:hypothetical protein [Halobacteroides halobius]AGB40866.1 hypothetical protein Halha_0900 [Halobacteroides halobius DSM 5150]